MPIIFNPENYPSLIIILIYYININIYNKFWYAGIYSSVEILMPS